jgi:hypothetical protein
MGATYSQARGLAPLAFPTVAILNARGVPLE